MDACKYTNSTFFYLGICIILGIYLYDTNIPFIKYIDDLREKAMTILRNLSFHGIKCK